MGGYEDRNGFATGLLGDEQGRSYEGDTSLLIFLKRPGITISLRGGKFPSISILQVLDSCHMMRGPACIGGPGRTGGFDTENAGL